MLEQELAAFTGGDNWTRWSSLLFPGVVASEGLMHLAERAGAYWLLDAIASHEKSNPAMQAACQSPDFDYLHFWRLAVREDKSAMLSCDHDIGEPSVVEQHLEFTDFPLQAVVIYAGKNTPSDFRRLYLPSEY